jgi:hypothetical protein
LGAVLGLGLTGAACSPSGQPAAKAPEPASQKAKAETQPSPGTPALSPKYREVDTPGAAKTAKAAFRSDTVDVLVAPKGSPGGGDKLEYKISMKAGDTLTYAWTADAEDLWHEFHGHTADTVSFYTKASGGRHEGALTAPFDGIHGWYFENRSSQPVIVRLRMGGFYELVRD